MSPETVTALDSIQVTMNAGGMNTINIVLAFVMFGVALGIKPSMFVEVFRKPKSVLLGMCCQLILLPLFTFLLAIALGPAISWTMALGMILVASCPGGNISNFMSSLSKANIELSVSLTAISTALAILMTPFNFWLYGNMYLHVADIAGEVPHLVIPLWDVLKTIFVLLGVPLTPTPSSTPSQAQLPRTSTEPNEHAAASRTTRPLVSNVDGNRNRSARVYQAASCSRS